MIFKSLLIATLGVIYVQAACERDVIEWTGGAFEWPTQSTKSIFQASGRYISKNIIATKAVIYKDEAIVALPRYKPGVPVTLAKVPLNQRVCESVLTPFPCWSVQEQGIAEALQSVVDIFLDPNGILWVLDSGVINTMDCPERKSPPKVLAFNMVTGKKVKTLDLSGLVAQASRLQYIVVEYAADGRPFAYVSDAATRSILVFDIAGNKGYRVVLPKAVAPSKRDVLYIALVSKGCGNNFLVFTYLSSTRVFSIRTDYLRAGSAAGKITDLGVKPSKIVILGTDFGSAVFFRYEGKNEVYRWDANKPFLPANFDLVYKSPACYLTTSVMADLKRQRMRVLESNFPDYIQNTVGGGASQRIAFIGGCL